MKDRESAVRKMPESPEKVIDKIVEQARHNPDAFDKLYMIYGDPIYSYVYHRVGDVPGAEDVTQRTFLRALNKIQTYEKRPGIPFAAWLFRIAHNAVLNFQRDEARRNKGVIRLDRAIVDSHGKTTEVSEIMKAPSAPDPEELLIKKAEREELQRAISHLSPSDQELLVLKYAAGLSNSEIAKLRETTEGAIKSRYHRILVKLRQELKR